MHEAINKFWTRISRIGLREGEDALQFREVILLNRVLVIMFGIMLFYIPLELYVNGTALIGAVLLMLALVMLTLVFHYFRLFRIGHVYLYVIINMFMVIMVKLINLIYR